MNSCVNIYKKKINFQYSSGIIIANNSNKNNKINNNNKNKNINNNNYN